MIEILISFMMGMCATLYFMDGTYVLAKSPEEIKMEKEIRASELKTEFLKGENSQLDKCNKILESMR